MSKKRWKKFFKFLKEKKILAFYLLIFLISIFFISSIAKCGDGTWSGKCSQRKPYFCLHGKLVEKASLCGCPETLMPKNDTCASEYHTNPKNVSLKYILKGKEKEIDFVVYEGFFNYSLKLPRYIYYNENEEKPSRRDLKMLFLNEKRQKDMLSPLIAEIQNQDKNKIDQVRIAISLVQNIPFANSNRKDPLTGKINQFRYPYEVLYDYEGICSEKTLLLAFILRELGYGIAILHYGPENHEVIGIECPKKYSVNKSGYCFIETTGPSIITDDKAYYKGLGKISSSPEIIPIFYGKSLRRGIYEYRDAKKLIKLRDSKVLNIFQITKLKRIKKKYGLNGVYV